MPYTAPTVNYSATMAGTYTTLTGVESVTISRGRRRFQDNFQASQCTIELIPATSYSPELAIGQYVDVRVANTATSRAFFTGQITDVERIYQIPYTSATNYAPADRIVITATGGTGIIAQNTLTNQTIASPAGNCVDAISAIASLCAVYGVPTQNNNIGASLTVASDDGAFDLVNKLCRTGQIWVDDLDTQRNTSGTYLNQHGLIIYPSSTNTATFAQSGSIKYNQLTFESSAQTRFNRVNVYADGLAVQTTQGTAPYNAMDYYTFNTTTGNALSLSSLLYNLFNGLTTVAPFTISTTTAVDDTWLPLVYTSWVGGGLGGYLGAGANITFRGTAYNAQIQHMTVSFYPDQARATFTLAPSLGQAFTLDSSQFGILDTNRLGYP